MKRITIFMIVVLGGMGIAFTVGKRVNADSHEQNMVVDTASLTKIVNDSGEALRINGKLVNPDQVWSGAGDQVEIYVPSKNGTYNLSGGLSGANVKFSELKKVVGPGKMDDFDIITASGTIGAITVTYEALPPAAD